MMNHRQPSRLLLIATVLLTLLQLSTAHAAELVRHNVDADAHARLFVKILNANKQWVVLAGGAHAALLETPRARLIKASVDFMQWMEQ